MIKRVLALIVALSLFVCTALVGFAVTTSASSAKTSVYYSYPYFSSCLVNAPLNGNWRRVGELSTPTSTPPYSSYTLSDSFVSSYPSLSSTNGFDFLFFYDDFSAGSATSKYNYVFSPSSPVSVPVSLSFNSSAPVSLLHGLKVIVSIFSSADLSTRYDISYGVEVTSVTATQRNGNYYFSFSVPYNFTPTLDSIFLLAIRFPPSTSITFSDLSISFPSVTPLIGTFGSTSSDFWNSMMIDQYFGHPGSSINAYYGFQSVIEGVQNSVSQQTVRLTNAFSPFLVQSVAYLASLNSYLLSQSEKEENSMRDAVPDRLPGQQQEAQRQLDDYEQKEQQIFDNLDTSLDNLNLGQYQKFDTSIVSSMTFINRYVTKGFDGLGNFKIILFLPMVIGIGLSVIGRMGAMMSHISVSDRRKGRGP